MNNRRDFSRLFVFRYNKRVALMETKTITIANTMTAKNIQRAFIIFRIMFFLA